MSAIRDPLFNWLFNASVQIGLFAILAAALSTFIAKAKAKVQHWLYLAIFALCLAAPVFNTLGDAQPSMAAKSSPQQIQVTEHDGHRSWVWNWYSKAHDPVISIIPVKLTPGAKTALLLLWLVLLAYQLIHVSRGLYRVHRLRRDALPVMLKEIWPRDIGIAGLRIEHRVALLQSTAIDDPVTIGLFHPAIVLPSKLLSALDETDLAAILAHEYGHIHRKDFLVHLLCQLAALSVAWHPGMRYLMARISQTRELACDDYAALRLGKRIVYARTLLRLASLCLQVPRSNAMGAMGLGIFDGDNLEDRIMMLTQKKTLLSRAGLIGLAFAATFLFASGTVLARAVSLHEAAASTNSAQTFAGTWHWMFKGHSFSTMILVPNGSGITGTVTPSHIALDDDGYLSKADPTDDKTPSPIAKTKLEGNGLRVTIGDGNQTFEFIVTLKDATHAEIHPVGAPQNMKPIQAERVN